MGRFTCPDCGKHRLIEKLVDVTLYKEVIELRDVDPIGTGDTVVADYGPLGEKGIMGGEIDYYFCDDCGSILGKHICQAGFFEWLREQGIWADPEMDALEENENV
ncbi:hypothetical protein LCGC14_2062970 [marine sediment metagenome]|uniref:Uncharacterized protein n=1 Tax=marine sediment metagenome TaxID=412755 RepID=A0A0F9GZ36_9ZZZZ